MTHQHIRQDAFDLYGSPHDHPPLRDPLGTQQDSVYQFRKDWTGSGRDSFNEHVGELVDEGHPHGVITFCLGNESNVVVSNWTVMRALYNETNTYLRSNCTTLHSCSIRSMGRIVNTIEDAYDHIADHNREVYAERKANYEASEMAYSYDDPEVSPNPEITLAPLTWDDPSMAWARERAATTRPTFR